MITHECMWLPWRLPVPDGWSLVEGQPISHHHRHARLIIRPFARENMTDSTVKPV